MIAGIMTKGYTCPFNRFSIFTMRQISITRPDDWHVHLRDGDYLAATVADISRYFGRAIVMPNLAPPVTELSAATDYRDRILSLVPKGRSFDPLMTLYLTDKTSRDTIVAARQSGLIQAFKLYPAGATTNSDAGVDNIEALYPTLEVMQEVNMVLAIHGEVTDQGVDIFDREAVFIERTLMPLRQRFPELRIILEHITTSDAVQYVQAEDHYLAATITAHHLMFNRTDMLAGGMKPIYYCLPVLKRDRHQQALIQAATSGDSSFFLGTDSAPHPRSAKENACGCAAGSYTAHGALELYAEIFDQAGRLDQLEGFASFFGADFYGLSRNSDQIQLVESSWQVPETIPFGNDELIPIRCGEAIHWTVENTI